MFFPNQCDVNKSNSAIEVGIYIVVKFSSPKTKTNKYYVGCVTKVRTEGNKNIFLVNFLRKQRSEKTGEYFTYPTVKDESVIEENLIVKVLKWLQT